MKNYRYHVLMLSTIALLTAQVPCWSEILFDEVSEQMGLGWKEIWKNGEAPYQVYTQGWPDFNSDGYPDLWISSHAFFGAPPQLWINQAGNGFKNIITKRPPGADLHCGSWGDIDNDGDPDLYIHAGAASGTTTLPQPRRLYINENGGLVDKATVMGLNPGYGSGRDVLWFDYNKDGRLDLAMFNETLNLNVSYPSKLFAWKGTSFVDVTQEVGISLNPNLINKYDSAHFGVITDLFGDNVLDFVMLDGVINQPSFITRVYRNEGATLQDISNQLPNISNQLPILSKKGRDGIIVDLSGDAIPDIFIVDSAPFTESVIYYPTDLGYLVTRLWPGKGQMQGVSFKTSGSISIQCGACLTPILIGSQITSPTSGSFFTLSSTDPLAQGIAPLSTLMALV